MGELISFAQGTGALLCSLLPAPTRAARRLCARPHLPSLGSRTNPAALHGQFQSRRSPRGALARATSHLKQKSLRDLQLTNPNGLRYGDATGWGSAPASPMHRNAPGPSCIRRSPRPRRDAVTEGRGCCGSSGGLPGGRYRSPSPVSSPAVEVQT